MHLILITEVDIRSMRTDTSINGRRGKKFICYCCMRGLSRSRQIWPFLFVVLGNIVHVKCNEVAFDCFYGQHIDIDVCSPGKEEEHKQLHLLHYTRLRTLLINHFG